jgi:hypothetical protein
LAIGTNLQSYSGATKTWSSHGNFIPIQLSVLPAVRSSTNQTQCDAVTAPNGSVCVVYTDQNPSNINANIFSYAVLDGTTGVYIVPPTQLASADPTYGTPRVFLLSNYFVILYTVNVAGVYHLKYIAVDISQPSSVTNPADIAASYQPHSTVAFDGAVFNNRLYIAYNGASSSGIKMVILTGSLVVSSAVTRDSSVVDWTMISVAGENTPLSLNLIWVTYYAGSSGYVLAVDANLNSVMIPTQFTSSSGVLNLATSANLSVLTVFYEISNAYSWSSGPASNYISSLTVTSSRTVSSPATIVRSVGIASKPFIMNSSIYLLTAYQSTYQSTYFLCDSSGNVYAKFAYQNGGGYLTAGIPSATVQGTIVTIPYLYQFAIASVNKNQNAPSGGQNQGVYAQKGVNLIKLDFSSSSLISAEIGGNLNLTGGFMWAYDGNTLCEQNFHLWPDLDPNAITAASSGGSITTQPYSYIATYEWQDNQGNIHRSGISVAAALSSSSLSGSSNTVTIKVPTLRLTYKINNPVKIVLYRASTAQPTYYQVTSVTSPTLNVTSSDQVTITDTSADSSIVGNSILYTVGGVLENTGGPACKSLTLFDNRLFSINAEDSNNLNFSQLIIDSTPVEMSLNLTRYVSPTVSAEGSTGPMQTLAVMDDKLIIFKTQALYYINGIGPDSTGNNNQYSEPIFITSAVGSINDNSIIFTPIGLMFQASQNQGIWLLGRDLSTKYIGAEVEAYNQYSVLSANSIPGTTYVIFTLSNNVTLMYDYYYNQWGTFKNLKALSGTIYQGLHTYINPYGQVLQENPGSYLDGADPVLMKIQTGWINLSGIQGLQRAYWAFLLGTYQSPHSLNTKIAYDYNPAAIQSFNINPLNSTNTYGSDSPYGSTAVYGGVSQLEQWRINFENQKCQSLQMTFQEFFNSTAGLPAGAGITFSGLTVVFGQKKGWPRVPAAQSIG